MCNPEVDEFSIMTYVSYFLKGTFTHRLEFSATIVKYQPDFGENINNQE